MAAGAAAIAAAIANAIKASGVLVQVEPDQFEKILRLTAKPLVIQAEHGLFTTTYVYLSSYKGFAFYTKSRIALQLPLDVELVHSKKIWVPS